ncbi:hypothetical protein H0X06_03815 [Candidatus Dependentiae bacterium]|nr:hypothetical protein [Candidatus Dependentiae bacterium]
MKLSRYYALLFLTSFSLCHGTTTQIAGAKNFCRGTAKAALSALSVYCAYRIYEEGYDARINNIPERINICASCIYKGKGLGRAMLDPLGYFGLMGCSLYAAYRFGKVCLRIFR